MAKQDLADAFNKFNEKNEFNVGDIVEWKRGMKTKKTSGPFVVCGMLEEPAIDTENGSGSPYFREPLDLIAGHINLDGDFICLHYDSRRLQPAD